MSSWKQAPVPLKIGDSVNSIQNGLAIVADGDTHAAIASGQFVYVKNHSTLSEGLYTANSDISANASIAGKIDPVSKGVANALSDQISKVLLYSNGDHIKIPENTSVGLSESIFNFLFVVVLFETNVDYTSITIPTDIITSGRDFGAYLCANSSSGQSTFPFAYNGSSYISFPDATHLKHNYSNYNNVNWSLAPVACYGFIRK